MSKLNVLLLLVIWAMGVYSALGSTVVWNSGVIIMPDGNAAGVNDVAGFSIQKGGYLDWLSSVADDSIYRFVKTNDESYLPYSSLSGGWCLRDGASDAKGVVKIENCFGLVGSGYPRCSAVMLYICQYDGYEYYLRSNGWCESTTSVTDPSIQYHFDNLASFGTWIRGDAVPEPSSALLIAIGTLALLLRRKA